MKEDSSIVNIRNHCQENMSMELEMYLFDGRVVWPQCFIKLFLRNWSLKDGQAWSLCCLTFKLNWGHIFTSVLISLMLVSLSFHCQKNIAIYDSNFSDIWIEFWSKMNMNFWFSFKFQECICSSGIWLSWWSTFCSKFWILCFIVL